MNTAAIFQHFDSLWGDELRRAFGPTGGNVQRYTDEGHGAPATPLRAAYVARTYFSNLWHRERLI